MIKTSGHRVNPLEIESVIAENIKDITKCAVFGIEDEKIEEQIVLVYSSDGILAKNEIIFELKKHLPTYMIPSEIVYQKSLPMRDGKVDKEALKREL